MFGSVNMFGKTTEGPVLYPAGGTGNELDKKLYLTELRAEVIELTFLL